MADWEVAFSTSEVNFIENSVSYLESGVYTFARDGKLCCPLLFKILPAGDFTQQCSLKGNGARDMGKSTVKIIS